MYKKVYVDIRRGDFVDEVTVKGLRLFNYDRHGDPKNGFEWGYEGRKPHALALSILSDHFGLKVGADPNKQPYRKWVQDFEKEVIAKLPRKGFMLTNKQIAEWIAKKESESRASTSPS